MRDLTEGHGVTIGDVTSHAPSTRNVDATDPVRLLADYRAGDFLFATTQRTVLATGVHRDLSGHRVAEVDSALEDAFAEARCPLAVGVIPFDDRACTARLVVPEVMHVAAPAHGPISSLPTRVVGAPSRATAVPEPGGHIAAVRQALDALRKGDLRKVVLARALDLTFTADVDPGAVLHNLVAGNPDGFTFAAGLPDGATLVGSTPELLVRRTGRTVVVHPHAGTAARSADPAIDRANAAALLSSAKDKLEHAVVVEAVVEALRPFCRAIDVPDAPVLTSTPDVWHLGTEITAELADDVSALRLAEALHPTPAVCGTPTAQARDLICELEPFAREYYAGAVGWVDAAGDGEWAVSIRCARLAGDTMRLYAGGGIVPASDPHAELDETSAKFATLLRAMGIDGEVIERL